MRAFGDVRESIGAWKFEALSGAVVTEVDVRPEMPRTVRRCSVASSLICHQWVERRDCLRDGSLSVGCAGVSKTPTNVASNPGQ